jgi:Uma2 family endonuclease
MKTARMPSAARSTPVAKPGPMALNVRGHTIRIPAKAWTLEGFRSWAKSDTFPDIGQFSYIGGEVLIDMSPEEIDTHNSVKSQVSYAIVNINNHEDLGMFLADRMLVTNLAAELSTEPDAGFLLYKTIRSGRATFIEKSDKSGRFVEVLGSPDWLLEIVSKHSVRKDTKLLKEKYHRAQVTEYWLIDARGRRIDFQIMRWEKENYAPAPKRGEWQWSGIFRRYFRLERIKNRVGYWRYILKTKTKPEKR